MSDDGMKIVELVIENIKRVQAITITPNGKTVILGGQNEQGKTSTLDAIAMTLGGGKLIPATPIRKGQKKGRIEIDLGDMIVERRFSSSGSTLEVRPKDGGPKFSSPQAMLDQLFGNLSFDPLAFTSMKANDQLKTLKEIVGIDVSDLDTKRVELYEERSLVNREAKLLEGKIAGMPEYPEAIETADTAALLAELKQAEQQNSQVESAKRESETLAAQITRDQTEVEALRQRAIELKTRVVEAEGRIAVLAESGEVINTQAISDRVINAQELNDKFEANAKKRETQKSYRVKNGESTKLTLQIENIDAEKEQRIADATFPVKGLAFGEDGVLFNGIPFEQASEEQQIVVSAAIGLALNPKLRVLLIRKAALLDEKHLAALVEWGIEHEVQLWIERVAAGSECSVIIEDGMILEDRTNGK